MAAVVAALVAGLLGGFGQGGSAIAATTTYSGPTGAFTIDAGDTAVLINGADITGDVLDNGTLQFDLSTNLTVSNQISGIGDVILTNTGTITFSGSNSYLYGTTVRYGELVITAGGAISHPDFPGEMTVGSLTGDSGTLRLTGGRIANYDAYLGKDTGSTGAAYVTSGTWETVNNLKIGSSGTGTMTISGGSVAVGGNVELGYVGGSVGTLTVSGGSLDVAATLKIGDQGDATMLVNGGIVSSVDGYIAGTSTSSSGTATITSGTWYNSRSLYVGYPGGGVGELNISGAGVVVVGDTLTRDPSLGTINLDAGGTLVIGMGGTSGILDTDLTNDGTLIFDRSDLSQYTYAIDGSGVVVKRGAGTLQFSGSNTYQGGTEILDGRIDVTSGGAIDHPSATLSLGNSIGAIGGLDVSGGVVQTARLDIANGDLNLTFGTVETGTARIGVFGTGTATIGGGFLTVTDSLFVGYSGTGTMDVNGGNVGSHEAILGALTGDYGEVSVTSGSVWENLGNLVVGGAGTGMLSISNGGSVLVTGTLSRGTGSVINLDAGGTLRIGNGGTTGTLATDLTNDGLLEFNRSNDYTYAGQIDGAGAVTKLGTGSLTFSGTSSYTGLTTIQAGEFYLEGQLGHSSVYVQQGALLGGSGTVLGPVFVGDVTDTGTAVISPGVLADAYATLSVGSLTLGPHSLTRLSVSGTDAGLNYDQIVGADPSTATLFYGGDMEITLTGSYADYTTFHLFNNFVSSAYDFNSITLNATGAYVDLSGTFSYDAPNNVWVTQWTPNHQRLVFSTVTGDLIVVPEPSTLVMATVGVGLAVGLRWRRRCRRMAAVESPAEAPNQA